MKNYVKKGRLCFMKPLGGGHQLANELCSGHSEVDLSYALSYSLNSYILCYYRFYFMIGISSLWNNSAHFKRKSKDRNKQNLPLFQIKKNKQMP